LCATWSALEERDAEQILQPLYAAAYCRLTKFHTPCSFAEATGLGDRQSSLNIVELYSLLVLS